MKENNKLEQISSSLIEARIFENYSQEFIINIIEKLNEFREQNGDNMIIDILFVKYIIKASINYSILNVVQALSERGEFSSQYHFAVALFCSASEFNYLRKEIYDQSWKLCIEDRRITINEIEISKVIAFYVLKHFEQCFNKDMIIKEKSIYDMLKRESIENKEEYNKKYNELRIKYNELIENRNDFQSYQFWISYISGQEMDKFTFDVENDPYLFNAAAKFCSENPLVKVKYDISKFKFPEFITLDMMYLIRYQLTANNLLNFDQYSIEIKNLCTLVYLLYDNQVPFKEIEKFENLMSSNSFAILILVYMNYTNEIIPHWIITSIMTKIDLNDSRNFLLIRIFNVLYKKFNFKYYNDENNDFLYIATTSLKIILRDLTNARYDFMKRLISKSIFYENDNKELIAKNKEDFLNFVEKYVYSSKGDKKLFAINIYQKYSNNSNMKVELIMYLIDIGQYNKATDSLIELTPNTEIINILKDEKRIKNIQSLLINIQVNKATDIYEKFKLNDSIDTSIKIKIFLTSSLSTYKYNINRKTLLEDSMNLLTKRDLKKVLIRINYISEKGQDEGGLAKDWFSNVTDEIIKTNALITTQNGTSLTFNPICDYQLMYEFIGKFIALAITNKKTIGLKLASFIWKKIMNEDITLEDMNDYDSEIYQSLKWISENDVNDLMMTFVDSNDEELCENGKNIELTNENKDKFVNLMIEKKLIKPNKEAIDSMIKGFRSIIDLNCIKIFKSEEIKEFVNGKEKIDIEDWKKNTKHNNKEKFYEFFEIISKWSQENLKKLIKFVTGSPIVPFEGFSYWAKYERSFTIEFTRKSSNRLPISHTCFNKIDIPIYENKELFEQKLLYAIDCNDFGFA